LAQIFLYAWFFATLGLILPIGATALIAGVLVDPLAFAVFIVLYWFLCPIPALFVALCVLFAHLLYADTARSENLVLTICTLVSGAMFGLPFSANLIGIAYGAILGFLSAVIALIMTKDLRLASRADEALQ
jgi:hypothetical protein